MLYYSKKSSWEGNSVTSLGVTCNVIYIQSTLFMSKLKSLAVIYDNCFQFPSSSLPQSSAIAYRTDIILILLFLCKDAIRCNI